MGNFLNFCTFVDMQTSHNIRCRKNRRAAEGPLKHTELRQQVPGHFGLNHFGQGTISNL